MKLIDTNRFFLAGTNNRFLHLATIQDGVREYMCFSDTETKKVYIEAITGGQLEFIEDDALAVALTDFLTDRGILGMTNPLLPDNVWYKKPDEK
jgi:hypothetical protein